MIWYWIRKVKILFKRMFCRDVIKEGPAWRCLRKRGLVGFYLCDGSCPERECDVN